jgi:N-acetyl-gamma-glutamyl-phosphate reductase
VAPSKGGRYAAAPGGRAPPEAACGLAARCRRAFHPRAALADPATLADGFFDVQACNDTNRVDIFVFASDTQALLMSRLDNLGKGASGAAVQSMNVHLGVDEGLGL